MRLWGHARIAAVALAVGAGTAAFVLPARPPPATVEFAEPPPGQPPPTPTETPEPATPPPATPTETPTPGPASPSAPATPTPEAPAPAPTASPLPPSAAPTEPAIPAPVGPPGEDTGQQDEPNIPTYDVIFTLRRDGVLHVRETISYDFGGTEGDGIVRTMPYRLGDRLLRIAGFRASSSTGAPAGIGTEEFLHELRVEIGAGHPVRGLQAYVLDYDVTGAYTVYRDRDEVAWDAVGAGWGVPIGEVNLTVDPPVRPVWTACEAGRSGLSTPCGAFGTPGRATEFTQSGLGPGEGMDVRVALPKGAVAVPPPVYAKPHLLITGGGLLALLLAGAGAAAVRLMPGWRSVLSGRRGILISGTLTAVTGVGLLGWDVLDDVVAHGLWSASIGDPAVVGLGLAVLGGVLAAAASPVGPWPGPGDMKRIIGRFAGRVRRVGIE